MAKRKLAPTEELSQLQLAADMVKLGARMQVLQAETDISRSKLLNLYREIAGESPPKGLLPSSEDWFLSWLQNIDSSLFIAYYKTLRGRGVERTDALVKAFQFYQEQLRRDNREEVLSFSRAWTLVRFVEAGILDTLGCTRCGSEFIVHKYTPAQDFQCLLCSPPSRAMPGKSREKKACSA